MNNFHTPVLLDEVIEGLDIKKNGLYIDGTIGGGGHAEAIIKQGGRVLGIDRDADAILHLKKKFESEIDAGQLVLVHDNFSNIEKIAQENDLTDVSGILLDLGVSSHQLDEPTRGFSFRHDGPLDMRMDTRGEITAADIINNASEAELYEIFTKYGEEIKAHAVVHEIALRRKLTPILTTTDLAEIAIKTIGNIGMTHPATRIFQALRMAVNDESDNLKKGIELGFKLLKKGGRMEIISFHSLEDRIVKLYFIKLAQAGLARIITRKPIIASLQEEDENRRARSAKLRIIARLG